MYAVATSTASAANDGARGSSDKSQFDAQVVRIWSGDQIVGGLLRMHFFSSPNCDILSPSSRKGPTKSIDCNCHQSGRPGKDSRGSARTAIHASHSAETVSYADEAKEVRT